MADGDARFFDELSRLPGVHEVAKVEADAELAVGFVDTYREYVDSLGKDGDSVTARVPLMSEMTRMMYRHKPETKYPAASFAMASDELHLMSPRVISQGHRSGVSGRRVRIMRQDERLVLNSDASLQIAAAMLTAPIVRVIEAPEVHPDGMYLPELQVREVVVEAMDEVRTANYRDMDRPKHPELEILACLRRAKEQAEEEGKPATARRTEKLLEDFGADGKIFWRREAARTTADILWPSDEDPTLR